MPKNHSLSRNASEELPAPPTPPLPSGCKTNIEIILETTEKGRCVQGKLEITSINYRELLRSSSWYHCLHVHIRFSMASVRFLSLFSHYCPSSREDKQGGRKRNYCLPTESDTPSGLRMSMIKYLRIESVLIGYQPTLLVLPFPYEVNPTMSRALLVAPKII